MKVVRLDLERSPIGRLLLSCGWCLSSRSNIDRHTGVDALEHLFEPWHWAMWPLERHLMSVVCCCKEFIYTLALKQIQFLTKVRGTVIVRRGQFCVWDTRRPVEYQGLRKHVFVQTMTYMYFVFNNAKKELIKMFNNKKKSLSSSAQCKVSIWSIIDLYNLISPDSVIKIFPDFQYR